MSLPTHDPAAPLAAAHALLSRVTLNDYIASRPPTTVVTVSDRMLLQVCVRGGSKERGREGRERERRRERERGERPDDLSMGTPSPPLPPPSLTPL